MSNVIVLTVFKTAHSNVVAFLSQWLIMLWIFGLQLFVSNFFKGWPPVWVGIAPVLLTVALVGWTVYKVVEETRIKLVQNNNVATTNDAPQKILYSPNGDKRVMALEEFSALYEPTHHQVRDCPFPSERGFRAYRPTVQAWAHRLTSEDVLTFFPKGRFISSSGAPVSVQSGQYIVMPFPQGDDVSVVGEKQFKDEYLPSIEEPSDGRVVSQADVLQIWDVMLRREGLIHVKTTKVHAKCMTEEGTIETVVNAITESRRAYEKGDYLVCGSRGGRYPMQERQFTSRYSTFQPEPASNPALASAGFKLFKAKGKVCYSESAAYSPPFS